MKDAFNAVIVIALVGGAFLLLRGYSSSPTDTESRFVYRTDWSGALQDARSAKKPIFLYFGGSW